MDPWPVAWEELYGGKRVDTVQESMKMFGTMLFSNPVETVTKALVGWRTNEEGLSERSQVKTSAADEQRHTATTLDFVDLYCSFTRPFDGGVIDVRRDKVDQVMWDAFTFFERDFGGGDLDLLINLDRVAVDYLAVDLQGDFDTERAFAGGCGTNDSEHAEEYNDPDEGKHQQPADDLVT
jgi:hypothetical protein